MKTTDKIDNYLGESKADDIKMQYRIKLSQASSEMQSTITKFYGLFIPSKKATKMLDQVQELIRKAVNQAESDVSSGKTNMRLFNK